MEYIVIHGGKGKNYCQPVLNLSTGKYKTKILRDGQYSIQGRAQSSVQTKQ
ncbi:MAG: hypothetical protein L3J31_00620 [Bacteroidales bacterium]|nr:hypothetical protein [Bacteroidales bacterium]